MIPSMRGSPLLRVDALPVREDDCGSRCSGQLTDSHLFT